MLSASDAGGDCPYPGLAAFDSEAARWFFGRDRHLAELTGLLDTARGIVVLVAPSGAGKSSLLRAGLIPALEQGALPDPGSRSWPRLLMTPTGAPIAALASQIAAATGLPAGHLAEGLRFRPDEAVRLVTRGVAEQGTSARIVLIIDQFEELFVLCEDEAERRAFITALGMLTKPSGSARSAALAVLGLRSDFYAQAASYPEMRAALQTNQLLMGPMTREELRQAIVFPARSAGLELEPGLVELLLRDLGAAERDENPEHGSYEAGRLPLLAHALRATWQQKAGHQLTVAGYQATGGVPRAVANSADRVYRGLDDAGQDRSRALFLRLTVIGETGEDTRRSLTRQELATWGDDPAAVDRLIEAYTAARLLTLNQERIEITHEALLQAWPRLRHWIDADRVGLRAAQEVEDAAVTWERTGCDSSLLYRGLLLENAVARLRTPGRNRAAPVFRSLKGPGAVPGRDTAAASLSRRANRFLDASIRLRRRVALVRRTAIAALGALTLVAGTLAGYATVQRNQAVAATSSAEFQQVTAEAGKLSATNTSLAALLDVAAYRMHPTPDGFSSLLATEQQSLAADLGPGSHSKGLFDVSADGKLLAVSTNNGVRLWDISGPGTVAQMEVPPSVFGPDVIGVSFSPTSQTLSVSSGRGGIRLWNLADPAHPTAEGLIPTPPGNASNAAWLAGFGAAGTFVVGYQSTLQVWNVRQVRTPALTATITPPCGQPSVKGAQAIKTLSVNASGSRMVVGCVDGSVVLVTGASSAQPAIAAQFQVSSGGSAVDQVAVDTSGDQVAVAAHDDDTFQVWNIRNQSKPVKLNTGQYSDPVNSLAFIHGTPLLAVGDQEGVISLWDVGAPSAGFITQGQTMQAGAGAVNAMAVTADGSTLVATYADDSIRIWHLPQTMSTNLDPFTNVTAMAVTPNGSAVAELKKALPGIELQVNPILSPGRLGPPVYLPQVCNRQLISFAFAPDGLLAAGCLNTTVQLWDIADLGAPRLVAGSLAAAPNGSTIVSMAFSPAGNMLAVGSSDESSDLDGTIGLWDISKPSEPELRQTINTLQPDIPVVAFADQGHTLAASNSASSTVEVDVWAITGYKATGEKTLTSTHNLGEDNTGFDLQVPVLTVPHSPLLLNANGSDGMDVWNVTETSKARLADELSGDTDAISDGSASHDGRWVVTTSYDDTIRLWQRTGPDQFAPFGNPLNPDSAWETGTAFSPADDIFVTLSSTGDIYLWNLDVTSAINRICADTANILTPSIWNKYLPGIPYQSPCS